MSNALGALEFGWDVVYQIVKGMLPDPGTLTPSIDAPKVIEAVAENLPGVANSILPSWNGRSVLVMGLATIPLLIAAKSAYSMMFDGQKTRETKDYPCVSVLGFKPFCWDRTCVETTCSVWNQYWNGCVSGTSCNPF